MTTLLGTKASILSISTGEHWWCNGQHCCLPSSRSGFDSRPMHSFFFPSFTNYILHDTSHHECSQNCYSSFKILHKIVGQQLVVCQVCGSLGQYLCCLFVLLYSLVHCQALASFPVPSQLSVTCSMTTIFCSCMGRAWDLNLSSSGGLAWE